MLVATGVFLIQVPGKAASLTLSKTPEKNRCGSRADTVRARLGVIRAAEPKAFLYYCARGIQNLPAAPAKKLQRFESLRLYVKTRPRMQQGRLAKTGGISV